MTREPRLTMVSIDGTTSSLWRFSSLGVSMLTVESAWSSELIIGIEHEVLPV
jgi:hypothetical protein